MYFCNSLTPNTLLSPIRSSMFKLRIYKVINQRSATKIHETDAYSKLITHLFPLFCFTQNTFFCKVQHILVKHQNLCNMKNNSMRRHVKQYNHQRNVRSCCFFWEIFTANLCARSERFRSPRCLRELEEKKQKKPSTCYVLQVNCEETLRGLNSTGVEVRATKLLDNIRRCIQWKNFNGQ